MKRLKRWSQDFFGRDKPLARFILLTALKESYLLLANTYGLFFHPRRTLDKLRRDRSQMAVFATVGFSGLVLMLITYWLTRRFFVN